MSMHAPTRLARNHLHRTSALHRNHVTQIEQQVKLCRFLAGLRGPEGEEVDMQQCAIKLLLQDSPPDGGVCALYCTVCICDKCYNIDCDSALPLRCPA
jgi:hypothetical protein